MILLVGNCWSQRSLSLLKPIRLWVNFSFLHSNLCLCLYVVCSLRNEKPLEVQTSILIISCFSHKIKHPLNFEPISLLLVLIHLAERFNVGYNVVVGRRS